MYLPTLERLFDHGEDEKIKNGFAQTLPDDPLIDGLENVLAFMRGNDTKLPVLNDGNADDMHFLRQIWALPDLVAQNGSLRTETRFPAIGPRT